MDSIKGVFWMFIICTAGVHCFEPRENDWKTTKNILCLYQNKGFGGKKVWESIMKGSYSPNSTVWLNGLVLRSPVMEYYGCYNIKFENGSEKLVEKNHFINCSKTCEKELKSTDGSFIALKGNACHCFKPSDNIVYVSSNKCSGSDFENNNNTHRDLYNVYRFTRHKPNQMVGSNCFSKTPHSIQKRNCSANLKFKCQKTTVKLNSVYTECSRIYSTYEDALNACQNKNMYITSDGKCNKGYINDEEIWSSIYAEETVLWDPDAGFDFDENIYQCLLAEYNTINKNYTLKTKSCTNIYKGICLFQSKCPTTRPNTSITSAYSNSTLNNKIFDGSDDSKNKDNTGMIVGIVSGIVLSAGLTIASLICWRRRLRYTCVTQTTESLYDSTVQPSEPSIYLSLNHETMMTQNNPQIS